METIEERVEQFMKKAGLEGRFGYSTTKHIKKKFKEALKEQDKITRHACAESLTNCPKMYRGEYEMDWVDLEDAQKAIINTKAI